MSNDTFEINEGAPQQRSGRDGCLTGALIGCGVTLLLLIILGAAAGYFIYRIARDAYSTDPVKLNEWLQEAVESEIPAGYEGKAGMNISIAGFGVKMIMIMPKDVDIQKDVPDVTNFMIFSGPQGMDRGQLEQQFEAQREQNPNFGGGKGLERVEGEQVTVKVGGHDFTANKEILASEDGTRYVQYLLFPKTNVVFVAMGTEENFDQEAFESFLQSMKVPAPAEAKEAEPEAPADEQPKQQDAQADQPQEASEKKQTPEDAPESKADDEQKQQ